ncbi:hypothetical protein DPMN_137177 [Dreissena polymorpha]|uniref:Uncharacterized protein n=1 Tax=Dreissena polymorpha TaxID=45954 RepID=A0A9D4JHF4_DREPO|nr:hypothetical protein DPMN_137177 [Dreissena polymorpha]
MFVSSFMKMLTRITSPPPGCHISLGKNLLIKFHDDQTINVASRVLTKKMPHSPGRQVFQQTRTIFQLIKNIMRTNVLTKCHEDRTINVTFRDKCTAPMEAMFFNQPQPFLKLSRISLGANLLTKFHKDQTINLDTRKKNAPPLADDRTINVATRVKNAPPNGGQAIVLTRQMLTPHHADRQKVIAKAHHEDIVLR